MRSVKKNNSWIFCFPVSRSFYDYHRSSGLVQQLHQPLDLPGLLGPHVQQVRPPHFTVVDSLHARCHDDRGLGITLAHLHVWPFTLQFARGQPLDQRPHVRQQLVLIHRRPRLHSMALAAGHYLTGSPSGKTCWRYQSCQLTGQQDKRCLLVIPSQLVEGTEGLGSRPLDLHWSLITSRLLLLPAVQIY